MNSVAVSFLAYTLIVLGFGIYTARFARRSGADFFLAGRTLGPWLAGLSYAASAESGWVTLGLVGMAFHTGIGALWIVPGTLAAFVLNWWFIAERLRSTAKMTDAITLPDVMSAQFGKNAALVIRWLGIVIILTMLTAYIAAQLTAAAKTFEATFGWNYILGVVIGASIVLIYTTLGGFRAVAWTDVLQAFLMISATVGLPLLLIYQMGGLDIMWTKLGALDHDAALTDGFGGKAGMALIGFFALWVGIPFGYPGQPHILLRFMAARDKTTIRRGAIISTTWVFFLFTGAVLLGIAARAAYGDLADAEKALPLVAVDILPGWLAGMMIAAVLSAVCSTADSQLLVAASSISHDLMQRILKYDVSEKAVLMIHRGAVLLIGLIAGLIAMMESRVIFHFVLYAWAGLGAAFGPPLILLLLWKRTTAAGVISGMIAGIVTVIVWVEVPALKGFCYEMLPAFLVSLLTVVSASLAQRQQLG